MFEIKQFFASETSTMALRANLRVLLLLIFMLGMCATTYQARKKPDGGEESQSSENEDPDMTKTPTSSVKDMDTEDSAETAGASEKPTQPLGEQTLDPAKVTEQSRPVSTDDSSSLEPGLLSSDPGQLGSISTPDSAEEARLLGSDTPDRMEVGDPTPTGAADDTPARPLEAKSDDKVMKDSANVPPSNAAVQKTEDGNIREESGATQPELEVSRENIESDSRRNSTVSGTGHRKSTVAAPVESPTSSPTRS